MEFKPVLRFAVMSDVHFCKEHPERRTTLKKAVKEVYKYSENEEYKKLDALYVVGDFTDRGKREEMEWHYDYTPKALVYASGFWENVSEPIF